MINEYTQNQPTKKRKVSIEVTWKREDINKIWKENDVKNGTRRPQRAQTLKAHYHKFCNVPLDQIKRFLEIQRNSKGSDMAGTGGPRERWNGTKRGGNGAGAMKSEWRQTVRDSIDGISIYLIVIWMVVVLILAIFPELYIFTLPSWGSF